MCVISYYILQRKLNVFNTQLFFVILVSSFIEANISKEIAQISRAVNR